MLILARALMGIGGACIYPSTLSILTNTFHDDRERARAIGIWAGVSGLGVAIGPLAGGLLVEHFWWGSVFLVNVPICVVAIIAGHFFVPDHATRPRSALDPWGAVFSIVALIGLLYAIIEVPDRAGRSTRPSCSRSSSGWSFLVAFGWWETHYRAPDARPALLPEPAVLRRIGHDHDDVLRPVRLDVPADPVLPVRAAATRR